MFFRNNLIRKFDAVDRAPEFKPLLANKVKTQKSKSVSSSVVTNTLSTIMPVFVSFLGFKENFAFMQINKSFYQFFNNNETLWKILYQVQYGKIYFNQNLKNQYTVSSLLVLIRDCKYNYNFSASLAYNEKILQISKLNYPQNWAQHYLGVSLEAKHSSWFTTFNRVQQLESIVTRKSIPAYFLDALMKGYIPSGIELAKFLFWKCYYAELEEEPIDLIFTNRALKEMLAKNNEGELNQAISLLYAVLYKSQFSEYEMPFMFSEAMNYFKKSLVQDGKFIFDTTMCFFVMLDIIINQEQTLMELDEDDNYKNNLEYFFSSDVFSELPEITKIKKEVFKELADKSNAQAAYYYAEIIYEESTSAEMDNFDLIQNLFLAKNYYLIAYQNGYYDAIPSLCQLAEFKDDVHLFENDQLNKIVREGARQQIFECMYRSGHELLQHRNWYANIENILIIQTLASYELDVSKIDSEGFLLPSRKQTKFFDAISKNANNPDASIYLHCALTLLYGLTFHNMKESKNHFSICQYCDPLIFAKYLSLGRQYGYLKPEHSNYIKTLANENNEDTYVSRKRQKVIR